MSDFNDQKHKRAEEAYRALRARSTHWQDLAVRDAQSRKWSPTQYDRAKDYENGRHTNVRPIARLRDLMSQNFVGGIDAIRRERFAIWYMLMGDVRADAQLGENTTGLRGDLEWEGMECKATLHAGTTTKLTLTTNTINMMGSALTDRNKIQKATGWERNDVDSMVASDISTLKTLASHASGGHSKFTRLVKGMLLYLTLSTTGAQQFRGNVNQIIPYTAQQVLRSFRVRNRSHAYCSKSSQQYTVLMSLIGQSYPFQAGGLQCLGNCTIPADGDEHYVVARTRAQPGMYICQLNAKVVWAGLVSYAQELEVSDLLEDALVTAASLFENRYLRSVSLPKVESTVDLVRPLFTEFNQDDSQRPYIDLDMATVTGRVHQMGCLLAAKDIIMAARASTKAGMNFESVVMSYLQAQESIVVSMTEWQTPMSIMSATREMKWMSQMNRDDIADIDSISILEGLWMCDSKTRSVEKGGISSMFHGIKDRRSRNKYVDTLNEELGKFGIVIGQDRIPTGRFSIKVRSILHDEQWEPEESEWNEIDDPILVSCDHKIPRPHYATKRRPRMKARSNVAPSSAGRLRDLVPSTHLGIGQMGPVLTNRSSSSEGEVEVTPSRPPRRKRVSFSGKSLVGLKLAPLSDASTSSVPIVDVRESRLGQEEHGEGAGSEVESESKPEFDVGNLSDDGSQDSWERESEQGSAEKKARAILSEEETTGEGIAESVTSTGSRSGKKKWSKLDMAEVQRVLSEAEVMEQDGKFNGQVDVNWAPQTIYAIRTSNGWKKYLKGRQMDPESRVFGKAWHLLTADMFGDDTLWPNIEMIHGLFRDSRTSIDLEHLVNMIDEGKLTKVKPRDVLHPDSFDGADMGLGDGVIADWMYMDENMAGSLGKKKMNRLRRNFRATGPEIGSFNRKYGRY